MFVAVIFLLQVLQVKALKSVSHFENVCGKAVSKQINKNICRITRPPLTLYRSAFNITEAITIFLIVLFLTLMYFNYLYDNVDFL